MANYNPFLSAANSRDQYLSQNEPDARVSKDPTSTGNPFLDAVNTSTNSRIKTKKQQEDEDRQKRLDQLAQLERDKAAQPQSNPLKFIGDAAGNVGNFLKSVTVDPLVNGYKAVENEFRGDQEIANKTQNGAQAVEGNDKFVQSKLNEIDRAEKAGEISKDRANQLRGTTQVKKQEATKSVEQAKESYKQKYGEDMKSQDENAVDFLNGITSVGGTGALVKGVAKGTVKAGEKAIGGIAGTRVKQIAAVESQEAVQDAARRKALGILDDPRDVPQGTTNPFTGENVGNAVTDVATPPGMAPKPTGELAPSRYVSKTLPESDFVGTDTKDLLGSSYETTTNAQRADNALRQLDAEGIDNFSAKVSSRLEGKNVTDQTVFDAQAAAQALEKAGGERNLQTAADIYNKLSTQLSKAGQTVQAASIMARQTPEGLSYYAHKQFNKAGVEVTPQIQEQLNNLISAVKEAAPKTHEAAVARDNVQYFIASKIPSSKADQVINFWRAGLLTSPTTTLGAIAGNTAQAIQRNVITDPIATLADAVMSLKTGQRTSAAASFGSGIKGGVEGAKVLGNKQYLKTGFNPLDPAQISGKYDNPRMTNYGDNALGKGVGTYVNGVYKIMGAADLPFRNAAQAKALSSMARSEAINRGLKGNEAKQFIDEFVNTPPKAAMERAAKEAEAAVFANDTTLGKAASSLAKNLGPVGQVLIPFAKVPSAVATKVITSTPIGTASEIVRQIIKVKKGGKFDQRAMAKAIGEGTTGVPIIGAGFALAGDGAITGGYPSTQAERDQWEAEGKKPNSIRIGDKWYSLNYIQPFATLLATGAKAREAADAGLNMNEIVAQATAGTGQSVLSQSFLQGLSGAIDAVKNPADFGAKFVANTASGIVPNAIRAAASASDPVQRDINDPLSGIIGSIPGLRQGLQEKYDASGNVMDNPSTFTERYLNPLKPSNAKVDGDTELNQQAIVPAKRLQAVRKKEINQLLNDNRVNAAQRKIDEYNSQVAKVISPYVSKNQANISSDQMDAIDNLFLGKVFINAKGRPYISSRDNLPDPQS